MFGVHLIWPLDFNTTNYSPVQPGSIGRHITKKRSSKLPFTLFCEGLRGSLESKRHHEDEGPSRKVRENFVE